MENGGLKATTRGVCEPVPHPSDDGMDFFLQRFLLLSGDCYFEIVYQALFTKSKLLSFWINTAFVNPKGTLLLTKQVREEIGDGRDTVVV